MSDIVNIGGDVESLSTSPYFPKITKVILDVNDSTYYVAGTDDSENYEHTLEYDCPWATQAMADNVLAGILGFEYKPFTATNALIDPAAELGDTVKLTGVKSKMYKNDFTFGSLPVADIAAEGAEEIDHEYPYESDGGGKELKKKLNSTGGDETTFGWELTEDGFVLSSGGEAVFTCNADGVLIQGNAIIDGTVYAKNILVGDTAGYITNHQIADGAFNGVKLADDSVDASRCVSTGSVDNYCMGSGSVAWENCDTYLKSQDAQIGNNATNISNMLQGTASFSALTLNGAFWFNGSSVSSTTVETAKSEGKKVLILV